MAGFLQTDLPAFGRKAAPFAEGGLEYDPHQIYGTGVAAYADPAPVAQIEQGMEPLFAEYRRRGHIV